MLVEHYAKEQNWVRLEPLLQAIYRRGVEAGMTEESICHSL